MVNPDARFANYLYGDNGDGRDGVEEGGVGLGDERGGDGNYDEGWC